MSYNTIIGENPQFRLVIETAAKVAVLDTPVLITGESGTGKEMLARFIHENSSRSAKPFIAVNMSAIPDNLLENELFGHVRGAYTDASDDYGGKIAAAEGGTLMLDEIGDMPLMLQTKLLRFLQFKTYEPIGSNEMKTADVRIIAATNKNLFNLLNDGLLREDLYYRLNVVQMKLPALRDRRSDIPVLAGAFIGRCAAHYDKVITGISEEAMQRMCAFDWPGNVRQLENAIERAVVLAEQPEIQLSDFEQIFDGASAETEIIMPLKDAIDGFKKEYITKALQANGWNQGRTAKALDIERTYLNRLIKTLHITKY